MKQAVRWAIGRWQRLRAVGVRFAEIALPATAAIAFQVKPCIGPLRGARRGSRPRRGLRTPIRTDYLSVLHAEPGGDLVHELRRRFDGKLIVNSGPLGGQTTREQALQQIEADHADAVVVGRALIANPDLVARWQGGHPENEPRPELFYGPGAEGYTDYPFLETA
ncbi:hypothetical protein ACH47C_40395 [Streptomyces rishiriensis]|uniref:hypothetical protein n=1 Tax=Streptomyces rishiriensis TaxID=68264 RepID=UPI0033FF61EB